MRDYKTSKFTTTIGITPLDKEFIFHIKGKKSMAGTLENIIKQYKIKKDDKS